MPPVALARSHTRSWSALPHRGNGGERWRFFIGQTARAARGCLAPKTHKSPGGVPADFRITPTSRVGVRAYNLEGTSSSPSPHRPTVYSKNLNLRRNLISSSNRTRNQQRTSRLATVLFGVSVKKYSE